MKRIAIIGAGPMGLSLAYYLKDQFSVVVFEADAQPGGMSASFDFDGVSIEKYYHFINLPDQWLFSLLRELGMEADLRWKFTKMGLFRRQRDGNAKLFAWGNPAALLKLHDIPLITRLRYGFHAFSCKFIRDLSPLDDMSAADWFRRWEGTAGYDCFWRFLFEKNFFELADPLSAAWIASRIRRVANSRKSLMQETLGYLEGGSLSLVDTLCRKVTDSGGTLHLSTPVIRVVPDAHKGGGIVCTDTSKDYFDVVVSTLPLPCLPAIMPDLPKDYLDAVRRIQNIGCICVLFRLGKALTDNFWLNVDMPEWDIPGIIEYSNLRPMDKTYVYVPFYMPHTHVNWTAPEDQLISKARQYLRCINKTSAETEEAVRVFRYEYAQPVCPPGFRHALPPYETGARHILAADTTHSFPEDRSINESVRIAGELAERIMHVA